MVTVITNGSLSGNSYHQHFVPRSLLTTPPAILAHQQHPPHPLHHQYPPHAPSFCTSAAAAVAAASTLCCLMCSSSSPITFVGTTPRLAHPHHHQNIYRNSVNNCNNQLRPFLANAIPVPVACIPCARWCDTIIAATAAAAASTVNRRNCAGGTSDWLAAATSSLLWPNQLFIRLILKKITIATSYFTYPCCFYNFSH